MRVDGRRRVSDYVDNVRRMSFKDRRDICPSIIDRSIVFYCYISYFYLITAHYSPQSLLGYVASLDKASELAYI